MGRIRVSVVDWQALFRKGVRFALSSADHIEIVDDTGSHEEALKSVESHLPDVVILNTGPGGPYGIQVTRTIKQKLPSVSVILVMDHQDDDLLFSAMKSGADACILKDVDPEQLISIISDVAGGAKPINKALLKAALARRVLRAEGVLAKLSVDEAEILNRIAEGTSIEPMAGAPGLTEETLDTRLNLIMSVLVANEEPVDGEKLLIRSGSGSLRGSGALLEGGLTGAPVNEVATPATAEETASETPIVPGILQKREAASLSEEPVRGARLEPTPASIVRPVTVEAKEDAGTKELIQLLRSGKHTEISPEINLALEDGFTYPGADRVLGTSGMATLRILESLADENALVKQFFARLVITPEGSPNIIPQEFCPRCDREDLVKGLAIEHSDCNYAGLETEFNNRGEYVCPKCLKKLRFIGSDYRQLGMRYRCNSCSEITPTPVIKFRSLRDGKVYTREELQEFRLNSYRLNPLTDFQSNSKACLLDFLRARGYNVEESPRVKGRSGAVHSLDILASRDDIIVQHHVGIGIFAAKAGETEVPIDELLNFQAKAADIGIRNLVVVAIPKLSPQAQSLAETQQIKVLTIDDIADLSSSQTRSSPETETANAGEVRPEVTGKATAPLTAEVTGPADQRKVLWIDKDVASSVEFARVLKIAGFEVMVFEDPDEGIQKVNEASLVVIDDELSNAGMLFSRIRNQAAVPIIVISSREGKDVRVTDDSGTADAYFKRTISGRELVARIRSVLRHQ